MRGLTGRRCSRRWKGTLAGGLSADIRLHAAGEYLHGDVGDQSRPAVVQFDSGLPDGRRGLLQELLWFVVGYGRSMQIAGMVGTVIGIGFVVLGLGLESITIPIVNYPLGTAGKQDMILVVIGALVVMQSFGIYKRAMEIKGWRKN